MGSSIKQGVLLGAGIALGTALAMQFSTLQQRRVDSAMAVEQVQHLAQAYTLIRSNYVEKVDGGQLMAQAINGMVDSLDPHSAYLDPQSFRELRESTEGRFVGLGIEVGVSPEGYVEIITPIEDSPADRAGIRAGDLITHVDGQSLLGLDLAEAVKRMRGEQGTKVRLTVQRRGQALPLQLSIRRDEITQRSVKARVIEPGYGWLRVSHFQANTLQELVARAPVLTEGGPLKGLVLDLRNDPGGLLQSAVGLAAAFLPRNVEIVSTRGQRPDSRQRFYGRPEDYILEGDEDILTRLPDSLRQVPMVVLVNGGSASASEIVAGALQDHKRATILGSQTFGKGSVQTVRQLNSDTALKLTTARYYTPLGRSIQARGILPDLPVDETAEGDPLSGLRLREADLARHLGNDGAAASAAAQRDEVEDALRLSRVARTYRPVDYGSADDFQLRQAINHLKGRGVQLSASARPLAQGQPSLPLRGSR
jgi:carboxyl-terminal processing protease